MFSSSRRLLLVLVFLLASISSPRLPGVATAIAADAAIGREFKARQWLAELGPDVPFDVVRYESIPALSGHARVTEYYEIDPEVVVSGYSYFFHVAGVDRDFMVGSVLNLIQLCRELEVVEEIKKRNKGMEVAGGLGQGLKSIGTGFGNLFIHPGQSLKGVGTRVRQTGRTLERAVGAEDKVGRDESGRDRSKYGAGPAGATRRQLAYALGVDVYTANPVLQDRLAELSQLRTIGGLGTWVIPHRIGMLSYLNPIQGDQKAELLIRDFAPYELRREVGKDIAPVVGLSRDDVESPLYRLLMNPNYSPRGIAYVGADIGYLRGAGNLGLLVDILSRADTPEEADMLALQLRLYSFLHRRVTPVASFVPYQSVFAALDTRGVFYFMFTGDTLRPWEVSSMMFEKMIGEAVALGARGMQIWTIGDIDPGMGRRAAERHVLVRQNILRDRQFFPAPEQSLGGQGQ